MKLRRRHRAAASGFTLIEVLVALFILALMAGMSWQGVDLVVRSRNVAQERLDALVRLQSALAQWDADLREVVDTQTVPGLAFDGARLRLTRRQPEGVQVIAWTLRGTELQRWSAEPVRDIEALQAAWQRADQLLGDEPGTLALLPGVSGWQLYHFYASSGAWSNAQSSGDVEAPAGGASAPGGAARRDALPEGVQVQISFGPGGAAAGTITRQMALDHP